MKVVIKGTVDNTSFETTRGVDDKISTSTTMHYVHIGEFKLKVNPHKYNKGDHVEFHFVQLDSFGGQNVILEQRKLAKRS